MPSCVTVGINESDNIVTIVLILGVTLAVTLIIIAYHLYLKHKEGKLHFKCPDIDWKAELLNTTTKKQKQEREERIAKLRAERERLSLSTDERPEPHSDEVEVHVNTGNERGY
ncbi:hypothetical protein, conserved [Angomonas deanei]|uniref:Uncharacterized protein n=1 Tax=Angomonas deanei TaxID=59799 RepID=A0A7G2C4V5_9TRYP|nr:hypothetical protein, conserved [Angomonas deanei]